MLHLRFCFFSFNFGRMHHQPNSLEDICEKILRNRLERKITTELRRAQSRNLLKRYNKLIQFFCILTYDLQLVCINYSQLPLLRTPSGSRGSVLIARVRNSKDLFQSNVCNLFLRGIYSCCPYYGGVRRVKARSPQGESWLY